MNPNNPNSFKVPLEWHYSEGIISRYATNMAIQNTENEFVISFFELQPPLLLGEPDDIQEKLKKIKSVRAECVARVIISNAKMPDFIAALQQNYEKSLEKKARSQEQNDRTD
jgi:hypothetical protein